MHHIDKISSVVQLASLTEKNYKRISLAISLF